MTMVANMLAPNVVTTHVTVAICTWNRAGLLAQTLEQLTRLATPQDFHWELLVVNNNCTDHTDQVLAAFRDRLPIRRVAEPLPGLCHARNRAILEANGAWLIFTDDDVLVDEHWLSAFWKTAARFPDAAVIGGPIEPWFPIPPDPAILEAFPIARHGFCGLDHGNEERVLREDESVYGANMAFRMSAIGGMRFDVTLGPSPFTAVTGDETDFVRRARANRRPVVWSPAMRVKHYVSPSRMTLDYLKKYYVDHARTLVRLGTVPASFTTPGPDWFGAPRWLWRSTVSAYFRYRLANLVRAGDALIRLREYCFLLGLLVERRAASRSSRVA